MRGVSGVKGLGMVGLCVHTKVKPGTSTEERRDMELGRSQERRSALQNKWMKGSGEEEILRLEEKLEKKSQIRVSRQTWEPVCQEAGKEDRTVLTC